MQCVVVRCNVLQCAAVCCSVYTVCCSAYRSNDVILIAAVRCSALQCVAVLIVLLIAVLRCAALCMQCVCSVLQCVSCYGVATVSRIDKIISLFCRILFLL